MAELKETHVVREEDGSRSTPWLAFAVGALLIALVAFFFINSRASFSTGPNGTQATYSVKGPAAPSAPAPAPVPATR